MDISEVIQQQTKKMIDEKLASMIEEKVSKMIEEIIGDIFRPYSDTGKAIKKKIVESIDVCLMDFNLVDYNVLVAKAIGEQFKKEIDLEPISKIVKDIIGVSEMEQISIYDICEKVKEVAMNNSDESDGDVSFFTEMNVQHGWLEIFADVDADVSKADCQVRVVVSKDRGTIFSMVNKSWKKRGKTSEVSAADFVNCSPLESFFFKLYNNQIRITGDILDFDTYWSRY